MPKKPTLLLIDDEASICFAFRKYFDKRGYRAQTASSADEGMQRLKHVGAAVVFLDVRLPDRDGLDLLEEIQREHPDALVIVVTAYGSIETAGRAIRQGAFDYLVKPLDLDHANALVEQAVQCLKNDTTGSPNQAFAEKQLAFVGDSPPIHDVFKRIARAATTDASLLITGETGTGKEVTARAVHEQSRRRDRPFVPVNCGAIPEALMESELFGYVRGAFTGAADDKPGRFEGADGGTLMLDEVAELSPAVQAKLLRFLDMHTIERLGSLEALTLDVRVIAATNRDLLQAVNAGTFRADLYYRLAVIQIHLPPLRDRGHDVVKLAEAFLEQFASGRPVPAIAPEALELLQHHSWPGNVRELRNAMEHAWVASGGRYILAEHLPNTVCCPAGIFADGGEGVQRLAEAYLDGLGDRSRDLYATALSPIEEALIRRTLRKTGGNQSEAAERLGIHRNTLRAKLRTIGFRLPEDRRQGG